MLTELPFQRGGPRHELEAEPVVDHREPARGEREALSVAAGDILAGRGAGQRPADFGRQLFREGVQLTLAERLDHPLCRRENPPDC